jgi:hypothetical protein
MDLFVTLNVATFKNILCIPIVCKYLISVVSMEMRGKNQNHVAVVLRAKKVGHQISVSFKKFDVLQALLSFF